MGDGNLGILLSLAMDATEAQQAVAEIGKTMPAAFQKVADHGAEPLNKSLLNTHQSIHLLAEEAGIHLPRAVISGISEAMPSIGNMGTALLAVFAVKEVAAFGGEVHKIIDEFNGVAAAEKRAEKISEENLGILEKEVEGNRQLLMGELRRAQFRAVTDEAELNRLKLHDMLVVNSTGIAGLAYLGVAGALGKVQEAQAKVNANQQLAGALAKILKDENEEAAKAAKEAAKEAADEAAKLNREWEDGTKQLAVFGPSMAQLRGNLKGYSDDMVNSLILQREMEAHWANLPKMLPLLAQSIQGLVTPISQVNYVLVKEESALKAVAQAMALDTVAQGELLAAGLAGLVAGRKAQAGVEAVWETARGIALLAEGSWPPNPAAIIAAGLHFESAAQYAIIAGSGSGRRGVPGAGAGSSAAYYGGADRSGSGASDSGALPQTLAPGASGVGVRFSDTARVVVFGTDHELQNWVAGAVNRAVQRGVTVQATSSQRGAPVGH